MRRLMEVLQVERVIPHLVDRAALEFVLPDFELDDEHEMVDDYCNVYSTPQARQNELEKNPTSAGEGG